MNQHQKIEAYLSIYDELDPADLQMVNLHLETCGACRATLAAYHKMDVSISAYTVDLVNQASKLELSGPIHDRRERSIFGWLNNFWDGLSYRPAAVGRLVVAGVFSLLLLLLAAGNSFFSNETSVLTAATATPTVDVTIVPTSTAEAANLESEKVIVRFGIPNRTEWVYRGLARAFEKQNPDIDVQLTSPDDEPFPSQPPDKIAYQEAFSKKISKVDAMITYESHQYLGTDSLHDLSSWVDQNSAFADDQFASDTMQMMRSDNGTWGIPLSADVDLIYYDKDAFDEAGLAYPAHDWSWEDFLTTAQQLTLKQEGETVRWGYVDPLYQHQRLVSSQLSYITDEQAYTANRQQVQDIIEEYVGLYLDSVSSPNDGSQAMYWWVDGEEFVEGDLNFATSHHLIDDGKAAMWPERAGNWQWHMNPTSTGKSKRIGVVPLPRNEVTDQTSLIFSFSRLVMNKQTEVQQETWRWLAYFSQNYSTLQTTLLPNQEFSLRLDATSTSLNSSNAELEKARDYAFAHAYFIEDGTFYFPPILIQKILDGELTIEQAVDQHIAERYHQAQ